MIFKKIKRFFDSQQDKKKRGVGRKDASDFLPSNATSLGLVAKILIANLDGLGGEEAAKTITKALKGEPELLAFPLNSVIKQPPISKTMERLSAVNCIVQDILREQKGALLIWGEMEDMGTALTIRFSLPKGFDETIRFSPNDEPLEIPHPAPNQLKNLIVAVVLSKLVSSYKGPRKQIAKSLTSYLNTVKNFVTLLPKDFSLNQKISILNHFGIAGLASWSLGNKSALTLSKTAFDDALSIVDKKLLPSMWCRIRNNQASLLETKGRLDKDSIKLKHAIIGYKEVARVLGRKTRPHEWGIAWARAALVLYRLGSIELECREQHLKASADAFDRAVAVCDRKIYPARWAEMMNQYGIVLMVLGEYIAGDETLERSVKCFREALKIRTKTAAPLLWAETANNLGAAGFALYKRANHTELLKEASLCFEGATDVFSQTKGYETKVSVIKKNLDRVRILLQKEKYTKE